MDNYWWLTEALSRIQFPGTVAWVPQATVDVRAKVTDEEAVQIAAYCAERFDGNGTGQLLAEIVAAGRLTRDIEIVLHGESLAEQKRLVRDTHRMGTVNLDHLVETIGGSPAISAVTAHNLTRNEDHLAKSAYIGSVPLSLEEVLQNTPYEHIFSHGVRNGHRPTTLSFETDRYKLMLSNSEGRNLADLRADGRYTLDVRKFFQAIPYGPVAIAISGLNKGMPREYHEFITWAVSEEPAAIVFVGTNSFATQMKTGDYDLVNDYWDVCRMGDITSLNESELEQLHTAKNGSVNCSRAERLRDLNHPGITVCHSAEGAAAYTNQRMTPHQRKLLGDALQVAVDATSSYYQSGREPRTIRDVCEYGRSVVRADTDFMGCSNRDPHIVTVNAPVVDRPLGDTTGLGARFDGYLMSIVLPLHRYLL
jgi:hypothetical protein